MLGEVLGLAQEATRSAGIHDSVGQDQSRLPPMLLREEGAGSISLRRWYLVAAHSTSREVDARCDMTRVMHVKGEMSETETEHLFHLAALPNFTTPPNLFVTVYIHVRTRLSLPLDMT